MRRLAVSMLSALATIAALFTVSGTAKADTAPSCTVYYAVTGQWSGIFQAQITVNYYGIPSSLGWTLGFSFTSSGQRIVTVWSGGNWTESGTGVSVTSGPYGGPVAAGSGTLQVGFVGSYAVVNPPPENFTFDGIPCTQIVPQ